ncbi:AIP3-domain-containing protein [Delitschia confertaspora ATCC 74209]|uniref:AIP3-domain-containing protein n=1 Tax=Delitschia confertaspora ATCC 74209 TaxID=1513339 RepID=A0A9P4JP39_9PLEO|nr:AIP3-domain-containing protein [Delitschia confertaspora ATCC 74209]
MQQPSSGTQRSNRPSLTPARESDGPLYHSTSHGSAMTLPGEDAGPRSSHGSSRSTGSSRRAQNPQQQLSQIEKSVTHLLVATKQLLETLTLWSRGAATESEVSDVYVRLGYEFNIASRAFGAIGVDTTDLGNVPELLRGILEETLSQEASQASLDNYLPRIRDIIINLLHGLKKKQQRLRQRSGRDGSATNGTSPRQNSVGGSGEVEEPQSRHSSTRIPPRQAGSEYPPDGPDLPPRSSSVAGRASPSKYDSLPSNPRLNRGTTASQNSTDSSLSSNAMQNIPVIAPYPPNDTMPKHPEHAAPPFADFPPPPPPPPPPPKQQDALAALQRGGELERRASRRFSAYQISKHLGTNAVPLPPSQNSPIPNRGKDVRESLSAVRERRPFLHSRQRSNQRGPIETTFGRSSDLASRRISEESSQSSAAPSIRPPTERPADDSPIQKTPQDKTGPPQFPDNEQPILGATLSGPLSEPAELPAEVTEPPSTPAGVPARHGSRKVKTPSPQPEQFVSEQSPQPGKELTLFLQYKSKIKKFVLADGSDLSLARLQLAFIEKFAWNTHSNGIDLPEIYIQDPVSGIRHELEDLSDIKDRSVLVLNVEVLDEVKRHFDDGLGGLRKVVEGLKSTVDSQQSEIQRVLDRQQQAAKDIASIAAAPTMSSARVSTVLAPRSPLPSNPSGLSVSSAAQLSEVQSLRRDLAVVRQTYSSFVSDIEASMSAIRAKAAAVKSTAVKAALPTLTGETGRAYVNAGKKMLSEESEKIVTRVDDLQDLIEDLRKDVVSRGVRPLPRQLEVTAKDLSVATAELKKMQDYMAKEKPLWSKIWEQELEAVCEDRELLTMQEDLMADLQDDLEKAAQTLELVEQATKQQNLQNDKASGSRSASGRNMMQAVAHDRAVDPRAAKDGVLGEVRALQPNHEGRLEAIERAEKARQRELESRKDGEFKKELGSFVEEGKLKKSGGVEEAERLRKAKDERIRKEVWERQNGKSGGSSEKEAAPPENPEEGKSEKVETDGGPPSSPETFTEAKEVQADTPEGGESPPS